MSDLEKCSCQAEQASRTRQVALALLVLVVPAVTGVLYVGELKNRLYALEQWREQVARVQFRAQDWKTQRVILDSQLLLRDTRLDRFENQLSVLTENAMTLGRWDRERAVLDRDILRIETEIDGVRINSRDKFRQNCADITMLFNLTGNLPPNDCTRP